MFRRLLSSSRAMALLVMLLVCCALAWFWYSAVFRANIAFLPGRQPAEWIVYPSLAEPALHWSCDLATVFKRAFVLAEDSESATLRVAGFNRYEIALNGSRLEHPLRRGRNWKEPDEFEFTGKLRPGTNELTVTVMNSNGPPALWLSFDAGGTKLHSDEGWVCSYAGSDWKQARLARRPRAGLPRGVFSAGEEPLASLRNHWLELILFVAIAVLGGWAFEKWGAPLLNWRIGMGKWQFRLGNYGPVIVIGVLWLALFANNSRGLPVVTGYDARGHMQYIEYIQSRHALPLPHEGWEMLQPPLYYLLASALLGIVGLPIASENAVVLVRLMGMLIGVAHFVVVWASLRLLFPGEGQKHLWGLVVAAFVPPMLYLSQFITNESLGAALVSASFFLTLRIIRTEQRIVASQSVRGGGGRSERGTGECMAGAASLWRSYAGLGVCLGLALLAKSSSLLVVPVIVGGLVWHRCCLPHPAGSRAGVRDLPTDKNKFSAHRGPNTKLHETVLLLGVMLSAVLLVCGWHYVRTWREWSPLIGMWDSRSGFDWWQDNGYQTSRFYSGLGNVLLYPWFASLNSFFGGLYSTLWGDGLFAGSLTLTDRAPWNFAWMSVGYWTALPLMLASLVGGVIALARFFRNPTPEWFMVLSLVFLTLCALIQFAISVPFYCTVKAFYGMAALLPFCAFAALGLSWGAHRWGRFLPWVFVSVWALNVYCAMWVLPEGGPAVICRVKALLNQGRSGEVIPLVQSLLQREPRNVEARCLLAKCYQASGDMTGAERQAQEVVTDYPNRPEGYLAVAAALCQQPERRVEATEQARRAFELDTGNPDCVQSLSDLLLQAGKYKEAEGVCREGLSMVPLNSQIRSELAAVLTTEHRTAEAVRQYELATSLDPNSWKTLNNLAWLRATSSEEQFEDGAEAVKLAERACELTEYKTPVLVGTLGAAYARAGRFQEAVAMASKASELAQASGQKELADKNRELIALFSKGQAYRDAEPK